MIIAQVISAAAPAALAVTVTAAAVAIRRVALLAAAVAAVVIKVTRLMMVRYESYMASLTSGQTFRKNKHN